MDYILPTSLMGLYIYHMSFSPQKTLNHIHPEAMVSCWIYVGLGLDQSKYLDIYVTTTYKREYLKANRS